jgi:hypothetical protein
MAAGTNIWAQPLLQVPPVQPSVQTAVPGLAAEATLAVTTVSTTVCDSEGLGACWETPLVIPLTGKEPRARWATPTVILPASKTLAAS